MAPVGRALAQAYTMASAGAYLHQYAKYGLELGEVRECFTAVEELLAAYAAL
jgi:hypothetical protein